MLSGLPTWCPPGQTWTKPPFALTEEGGRYYGRGVTDMKGFVACALTMALRLPRAAAHAAALALSYDEEVGCLGVRSLIAMLEGAPVRPAFCIVGEPTGMQVATGTRQDRPARHLQGREGHSALAPMALNALHLGADFLNAVRALQAEVAERGLRDGDYDVPYTTVHVGKMNGGVQVNIVPNSCVLDFEIRNLAEDDPQVLIDRLTAEAQTIVAPPGRVFRGGDRGERLWDYPGSAPHDGAGRQFRQGVDRANGTMKVAFGTEGGSFRPARHSHGDLRAGSMAQGHKPDEWVSVEQIGRCEAMLAALLDRLEGGL